MVEEHIQHHEKTEKCVMVVCIAEIPCMQVNKRQYQ